VRLLQCDGQTVGSFAWLLPWYACSYGHVSSYKKGVTPSSNHEWWIMQWSYPVCSFHPEKKENLPKPHEYSHNGRKRDPSFQTYTRVFNNLIQTRWDDENNRHQRIPLRGCWRSIPFGQQDYVILRSSVSYSLMIELLSSLCFLLSLNFFSFMVAWKWNVDDVVLGKKALLVREIIACPLFCYSLLLFCISNWFPDVIFVHLRLYCVLIPIFLLLVLTSMYHLYIFIDSTKNPHKIWIKKRICIKIRRNESKTENTKAWTILSCP
jgi:hypothetical protein